MNRDVGNPFLQQDAQRMVRENPSYGSELPQDFPYDPGATRNVFDLGYIPSQSSVLPMLLFCMLFFVIILRALKKSPHGLSWGAYGFVVALLFVFLGPLKVIGVPGIATSIGIAKAIAGVLLLTLLAQAVIQKKLAILSAQSIPYLLFYGATLVVSGLFVTNPYFYLEDMRLIISGLVFYILAFAFLGEWNHRRMLATLLAHLTLFPSLLVLVALVSKSLGATLMGALYPRYENIVFLFDATRDRVLSVIDIEFFIPFILYLVVTRRRVLFPMATLVVAAFAVLLTNYRYRFLTLAVGVWAYVRLIPTAQRRFFIRLGAVGAGVVLASYIVLSLATGRVALWDRFLLRDYRNDVDSLRRRVVMAQQAIDLFTQYPIFGVGTGNYKDNVQVVYTSFGGRTYEPFYKILQNVYAYPHNWFLLVLAENGVVGFTALLLLLYHFAKIDTVVFRSLRSDRRLLFSTFSLISWLFVFANQFTPLHNSEPVVIFFWSFRGMIERIHETDVRNHELSATSTS